MSDPLCGTVFPSSWGGDHLGSASRKIPLQGNLRWTAYTHHKTEKQIVSWLGWLSSGCCHQDYGNISWRRHSLVEPLSPCASHPELSLQQPKRAFLMLSFVLYSHGVQDDRKKTGKSCQHLGIKSFLLFYCLHFYLIYASSLSVCAHMPQAVGQKAPCERGVSPILGVELRFVRRLSGLAKNTSIH